MKDLERTPIPVESIYSYIRSIGSRYSSPKGQMSPEDLAQLGVPASLKDLDALVEKSKTDAASKATLKNYFQIIQDESLSIKNAIIVEPIGDKQKRILHNKLINFYFFIKSAEYITKYIHAEVVGIIDKSLLQENKNNIRNTLEIVKASDKKLKDIVSDSATVERAVGTKLNRFNPEADLESFKKPGVYIYQLEEDLTKTKYLLSQNKPSDERGSDPSLKPKVDFNIPEGQRKALNRLKTVVGLNLQVENFEAGRIEFPAKKRSVDDEQTNKRQKTR